MADPASAPPASTNQGLTEDHTQANKGPEIIAIITIIVAICTVFVFARLFVRTRILGKLEVDDCLILLGAVSPVSLSLSCFPAASHLSVITQPMLTTPSHLPLGMCMDLRRHDHCLRALRLRQTHGSPNGQ